MPFESNDQIAARLDKLAKIREKNINPYPYHFEISHNSQDLHKSRETLLKTQGSVTHAGRIVRFNRKGKMAFLHVKDGQGRIQAMVTRDSVGPENYQLVKLLDIGDWVGLRGTMFVTKTGEYTILGQSLEILAKALRPLPIPKEKVENGKKIIYDEFKDKETRYRHRYLDLTLNDSVRETFLKRSRIIQTIRSYLVGQGFMEVETPVLQSIYGGANARPFTTHHNTQRMDLYLRISNELYLKRLVIGGILKVFEFSRNFRNEGIDKTHNPEFTVLEFYQSFVDYNNMMTHIENIFAACAEATAGTTTINYQGTSLELKPPWPRLSMKEALYRYSSLDVDSHSDEELQRRLVKEDINLKGGFNRGLAVTALFEHLCETSLVQPVFITDHPKETTPLCKVHREDPNLIERFEPYINGWEMGNAYSELNDPVVQRRLLKEQVERGRAGEDETHPLDEDFIMAMEYGMPPMGGAGIGIDRLIMLLTNATNIKDVLFFPLMRPE